MKAGRKKQVLTEKESAIMNMLWEQGPMFVREMLEHYPSHVRISTRYPRWSAYLRGKDM